MSTTEFLTQKRKTAFRFFDANKDGVLTATDFMTIADYISKETGAGIAETSRGKEEWVTWFKYFQGKSEKEEIDEKTFLANCEDLCKDLENYKHQLRKSASEIFDHLDLDKDGKITVDELTRFYGALGVTDKFAILQNFSMLDKDSDGFLQRDELMEDMVRHFTDPNPVTGQAYLLTVNQ